jgi:allantoin racemase
LKTERAIVFVNPNSTQSMTDKIVMSANTALNNRLKVQGVTCFGAPSAIQGPNDAIKAKPILFSNLKEAENSNSELAVIACFDDPFLLEARETFSTPTIGIGWAAFTMCSLYSDKFGVITTMPEAVPVIQDNLKKYGLFDKCSFVHASNIPVLEFETKPEETQVKMREKIRNLLKKYSIGSIALGCAGMTHLAKPFSKEFDMPIVDGVYAAALLGEGMLAIPNG